MFSVSMSNVLLQHRIRIWEPYGWLQKRQKCYSIVTQRLQSSLQFNQPVYQENAIWWHDLFPLNSCLILDVHWCHNCLTQCYHIREQVNNKDVLGVPGLTFVKVITSTKTTQVILSPTMLLCYKSLVFCVWVPVLQYSHIWAFISDFTLYFSPVSCWRASAVTLQKRFCAWRIVTPLRSELWWVLRWWFYSNETIIMQ